MDISDKIPPVDQTAYSRKGIEKVEKAAAPAAKGDRVQLSARARELQAAHAAIEKMDDVDHEKVARIKARIEAGTYQVDAAKVAEKMLQESLVGDAE